MRWREGAGVDLFVQLQRGDHISKLLETVFIMIMMIMYSMMVVIFMMMLVMFAQLQRRKILANFFWPFCCKYTHFSVPFLNGAVVPKNGQK